MKLSREQEELLTLVRRIWEGNPSLRFFQIFGNCTGKASTDDIYFVSDDQLIRGLETTYNPEGTE